MIKNKKIFYLLLFVFSVLLLINRISAAIPAGTTLFQENFEDTNLAARGWYDTSGIAINSSQHVGGSTSSLQIHFSQGTTAALLARHSINDTDSVYLSYWVKYSSNWVGSGESFHPHESHFVTNEDDSEVGPSFTNLTTYIEQTYQNGVNRPRLATQDGNNINNSSIGVNLIGVTENRAVSSCNGIESSAVEDCYTCSSVKGWCNDKTWTANSSQPNMSLNQWHFVQAYFKLNTIQGGIGQADGSVIYYLDGQKIFEYNNIYLRTGVHPNMKFDQYILAPYIGDGSPADQYMWIDNLTVATGDPTASSQPTVALNTPVDNYNITSQTIFFNATGSDNSGLANMTLYGNWTGSWVANKTNSSPSSGVQTTLNVSNLPKGKYIWNVLACDSSDNCTFASSNRTFTVSSSGDVNNDNKVDISDILVIIKYILGIDQTNNAADVNGDGTVNIFDLVSTAKYFGKQYGTDTTPPSIINSTPSNNTLLASGTTQQAIFIETNEVATCKYANFSSGNFTVNMTSFTKTGGIAHTVTITDLQSGNNYYYIKCQDASGNLNNTNYIINISVQATVSSQTTVVINDSFESGNLNSWFNDGGGAVITTDAHTGNYAANYDPNRGDAGSDHFGKVDISPTFREAYLRMWVKFQGDIPAVNGAQAGAHFWRFINWPGQSGGFGPQLDMNMNDQTYWLLYYLGGDIEKAYTNLFQKNVWQEHVFRIDLDTNQFVYQVNGQNMVNEQGGTNFNQGWNGGFDTWIFTNYDQGTGGNWSVDDVLLVTGPGAYNYTDTG